MKQAGKRVPPYQSLKIKYKSTYKRQRVQVKGGGRGVCQPLKLSMLTLWSHIGNTLAP